MSWYLAVVIGSYGIKEECGVSIGRRFFDRKDMEEALTEELLNGINTIMVKLKEVPLRLSLEVRVQNKGRGQALLSFNAKNGHDYKIFAKRLRGEGNWEEARIILEDIGGRRRLVVCFRLSAVGGVVSLIPSSCLGIWRSS